ncbi:MAG: hypothetical protein L6R43_00870 [Planctomycetes bacterium]|nr:hypothetical protein [Planctomycetota bacterium]
MHPGPRRPTLRLLPLLALPVLLLLASGPLPADTFVLRNGQEIDGFRIGKAGKSDLLLGNASGTRKVSEAVVAEVRPSADPPADFKRYWAGLGRKDADAAAALGAWAKERGLPEEAKRAFARALELKPDHPVAREGTGFVLVDGQWVAAEEVERARAEAALRQELVARHGKAVGAEAAAALSEHWRYVSFLGDAKEGDRVKDLEAAFAAAKEVLGSDPWKDRALAVACSGTEQYHRWIDTEGKSLPGMKGGILEGVKAATGLKWLEPAALVRSDVPDTYAMHGAFVHSAGHLLVHRWGTLNREIPFWIEEGFGGWMEQKVLQRTTSFCRHPSKEEGYGTLGRGSKQWDVDQPDWHGLVRKAAAANEFLPLDQLDSLPPGQFSGREVGQAFSFMDFLLTKKDHARLRDYLERVKGGVKSPVAFKQAYGATFEQIEPEWKDHARTW